MLCTMCLCVASPKGCIHLRKSHQTSTRFPPHRALQSSTRHLYDAQVHALQGEIQQNPSRMIRLTHTSRKSARVGKSEGRTCKGDNIATGYCISSTLLAATGQKGKVASSPASSKEQEGG